MRSYAADDFARIRTELRRNRVITLCAEAGVPAGTQIPDEIMLAAGYDRTEIDAFPALQKRLPLLDGDLR